jgi:serine/threonine-protein kinase
MIGQTVGHYRITDTLGAGGMGVVYRATDTRLGREVAIKFATEGFSERFEREARAVAALNHPNICTLYDVADKYLVMELVEGPTLAERIKEGPVPLDEALGIAMQIAAGLEAAHDSGIVHRDLKPGNVKIKPDGTVKVLDFGLAKRVGPAEAGRHAAPTGHGEPSGVRLQADLTYSPTLSMAATQMGVILGTAAYMAPEQAKGKPVDKRADIWAFGVVLYEMLTARRPFQGDDVGDVLAAVIKEAPGWDGVPKKVRPLLQRCLEKDPKKRLRDISGVGLLLEEAPAAVGPARLLPWFVAGAAAVVAAVALLAPWRSTQAVERPLVRLDVDLGSDVSLGSPQGTDVIISPDGNRLVFVSQNRLFTRRLDQPKAVELAGAQGAGAPFFSPDGQWVAFVASGQLKKISVDGGAAVTLCATQSATGGTWSEDGTIVASLNGTTLSRIPDSGGPPTRLTELAEGERNHRWPQILPGGKALLLSVRLATGTREDGRIDVVSVQDGRRKMLQQGGLFGRYVVTSKDGGSLIYVNKGTVFGVPMDLDRLEVRGTPSPVLEDVRYSALTGGAQMDASRNGTLVYRVGSAAGLMTLQWLDSAGKTELLPAKPGSYGEPVVSPDGRQIALTIGTGGSTDIWVYDWQRDAMSRLTFGGGTFVFPVWHPGGRYIAFSGGNGGGGMFWTRADGASKPQPLTQSKKGQFPWSFSPDGKRLAYADFVTGGVGGDIWTVPVEIDGAGMKAGKPELFLETPANELYPAFSPDGRWIAYRSNESGSDEIYVRAFPDKGGRWLISTSGGVVPVWSRNGRELFYRTADQRIMVVAYAAKGDVFVPDKPRLWTEKRPAEQTQSARNLDLAPDGKRFIALMPVAAPDEQRTQNHVIFLQNFADEVRRRAGGRR